jgi:tRNA A37 threonylcarbamoyladenosine synthetase subunit TsaC/SUA5/YrdC
LDFLEHSVENHTIATTSANISGDESSVTKEEVIDSVGGQIDFILDGEEPTKKLNQPSFSSTMTILSKF